MKPKRKKIQKDILFIFISSFVVVVAWIGFNIYHIYATSTVSQDIQMQLTPIDPVFDPLTMQQLKNRESIVPQYKMQQSKTATVSTTAPDQTSSTPAVSGIPDATTQNETVASSASRIAPTNTPINRAGQ
jgi:hypothetical protein